VKHFPHTGRKRSVFSVELTEVILGVGPQVVVCEALWIYMS